MGNIPLDMYAEYLKEKENSELIQNEFGFIIIQRLPEALYLKDIYIKPEYRRQNKGREFLQHCEELAKKEGFKAILGSIDVTSADPTTSMKAQLACGFKIFKANNDFIVLIKEV